MKKIITRIASAALAGLVAFAPIAANAAEPSPELRNTTYNTKVTKSDGSLKLGYFETDDSSKTWWKTETYFTDWVEVSEADYNAVKDADLKKMDDSGRTDWRNVDAATYEEYLKNSPNDARKNGYTDYYAVDKETFDKSKDPLKRFLAGEWQVTDKATYDAETDDNKKFMDKSDWQTFADAANWNAKYDAWLQYPAEFRRAINPGAFKEVSKAEYQDFAAKFAGLEGQLFKYEEIKYSETSFPNWIFFDEQVIANVYNTNGGHDPFFVLVGEHNNLGSYQGCEGGTWDGKNDGMRFFNADNGVDAQNVANYALAELAKNNVPVITVNGSSDIPSGIGPNKFNAHVNDGIHNAGKAGGNDFIDIVDEDFHIYFYAGEDEISVEGFYGILIAPNATVNVGGKWIGTIIADTVNTASNWNESTKWCYPIDKGSVEYKYFISDPTLEVKEDVYKVRTVTYEVRDEVFQVRDVVKKFFIRGTEDKVYYCDTKPYVPQTGDIDIRLIMGGVLLVIAAGCALIVVSRKKETK